MQISKILNIALFFSWGVFAQQVNVRGKVADEAGEAVANAIIEIAKLNLKDTTGTDGAFAIAGTTTPLVDFTKPITHAVNFNMGILVLSLEKPTPVKIEIFDTKGNAIYRKRFRETSSGNYRLDLRGKFASNRLSIVRASFGNTSQSFTYLPMSRRAEGEVSMIALTPAGEGLAKAAATVDSLKLTADGFEDKILALSSYDTTMNITLTASPQTSAGCGAASPLETGTFTESINGINRRWMLDVPADYDPDKPYRLIFVWHPLTGSGTGVVQSGFDGLKSRSGGTAIFATADGLDGRNFEASGTGWWNADDGDMKLVQIMLAKIKGGLCIDQKRIFSTGFSFGGMMSYTLPEVFDDFRAVAPCSGKDDIIPHDENFNNPIPIMAFHGDRDNFVLTSLGKEYFDKYAARNQCGNTTRDVSPNGCVQYEGCAATSIWCLFPGGHTTWSEEPDAIWNFFSQF